VAIKAAVMATAAMVVTAAMTVTGGTITEGLWPQVSPVHEIGERRHG
jgi:hypothetical protein